MGVELILVLVILTNLKLLGSSRLGASIRVAAAQGVLLGLLPLLAHAHTLNLRLVLLTLGTIFLKGVVFPRLLFRALREADVSREVEPYIGYGASLLVGMGALVVSFWLGQKLPLASGFSPLLVPVAIFSIWAGFFLIIGRMRAVSQVGLSDVGKRDLCLRRGRDGSRLTAGRTGGAPGYLCRRLHHGHHDIPY